MTCRAPLEAAQLGNNKPVIYKRGHRPKTLAEGYAALDLPCGKCVSCRREKGRIWAVRMMHEAQYWEDQGKYNIFLTLTYNDDHLPMYGTLCKHHVQDFLKRLRWHISPNKFRYYVVGEYGSTCPHHEIINCPQCGPIQRPHYHMIIFGWSPLDQEMLGPRDGHMVYRSPTIETAWTKRNHTGVKSPIGDHEYGSVTFESCSYLSDYFLKRQNGAFADEYYCKYFPQLDVWVDMPPEFSMMSKGGKADDNLGGIGKPWYDLHANDCYPSDETPIPGRFVYCKPPKYYDELRSKSHPEQMEEIKQRRRQAMAESLMNGPTLYQRAQYEDAILKRKGVRT